mmetsp:Transcript_5833/g.16375  ORF Transcript_5833/g.16375 Transcript_5833/m.16375 type:complete len:135 (-) Transcript_5833:43-447(-)
MYGRKGVVVGKSGLLGALSRDPVPAPTTRRHPMAKKKKELSGTGVVRPVGFIEELLGGHRKLLAREQRESSMGNHGVGEVVDQGEVFSMEVAENGVGAPPANQLYEIDIDPAAEQRHGAARAEGMGGDVVGVIM